MKKLKVEKISIIILDLLIKSYEEGIHKYEELIIPNEDVLLLFDDIFEPVLDKYDIDAWDEYIIGAVDLITKINDSPNEITIVYVVKKDNSLVLAIKTDIPVSELDIMSQCLDAYVNQKEQEYELEEEAEQEPDNDELEEEVDDDEWGNDDNYIYDDDENDIDPMEIKRDAWGQPYSVGEKMFDDYMNRKNKSDEDW